MASSIVLDSGIILAAVFVEPLSIKADGLLQYCEEQRYELFAPALMQYELISVLRKNIYRKLLAPQDAGKWLTALLDKVESIQFLVDVPLLKRAYELAEQLNRPSAYDAQYLAVAERLGCDFWTADERLFNAASGQLKWVKWLKDFDENLTAPRS